MIFDLSRRLAKNPKKYFTPPKACARLASTYVAAPGGDQNPLELGVSLLKESPCRLKVLNIQKWPENRTSFWTQRIGFLSAVVLKDLQRHHRLCVDEDSVIRREDKDVLNKNVPMVLQKLGYGMNDQKMRELPKISPSLERDEREFMMFRDFKTYQKK